jgi:hypothetical protein
MSTCARFRVAAYYQNTAFAADPVLELERIFRSAFYVGPLREYPKRLYSWSGELPDHVGARGDRAIEAVLAGGDRSFNWKSKQKTKSLPAVVAERLRDMRLIHEFQIKASAANQRSCFCPSPGVIV